MLNKNKQYSENKINQVHKLSVERKHKNSATVFKLKC